MTVSSEEQRAAFAALHTVDDPLVLFNIWDAGSAVAVAAAGAKAIATGSASVAGAQGFEDGEELPFEQLLSTVRQICAATDCPVSVDFESGCASHPEGVQANAAALHAAGAIGCNLEDLSHEDGEIRDMHDQAKRIAAAVAGGLFVNARTDTFLRPLMSGQDPNQPVLVEQAIDRAQAYLEAGAGSFFIPGLSQPELIAQVCSEIAIPVNVMRLPGMVSNAELAALGVARISYGPGPWRDAMSRLTDEAKLAFS